MKFIQQYCKERTLKQRIAEQRGRLFRIAYSWCHDRNLSDDLTQETLAKALNKYESIRNPDSLDCWLYGILANCWRDHFRRQREHHDIDEYDFTNDTTPERDVERQVMTDTIQAAVAELPMGQRQVLTLVDLEGCSYAEVASILDTPIGTVMSRLCRARKVLANNLLELKTRYQHTATPALRRVK